MALARPKLLERLAIGSMAVSLLVLGLKYIAYLLTGSVALLSDAIETIINVVTAVAAYAAIRISARPPDADHPYGHAKAEYLSAVLEGVLIIVAALAILREAYAGFRHPALLATPARGLFVNGAATLVNAGWSWVLISQGRKNRSPALLADGRHLLTDLYTSVGVFVGVVLVVATGWRLLDPLVAALVALNVVRSGWRLMSESVGGLMDAAIPDEELDRVRGLIFGNIAGAIEAHDLRTRRAGRMTFIDFHLIVAGRMTVRDSHAICDRLEGALKGEFPDALISIHVEPEHKLKNSGLTLPAHPIADAE